MGKTNAVVEVFDLLKNETDHEIAVGATATAYTETFACRRNVSYAFEYKFE
jgi:hypothetical protein